MGFTERWGCVGMWHNYPRGKSKGWKPPGFERDSHRPKFVTKRGECSLSTDDLVVSVPFDQFTYRSLKSLSIAELKHDWFSVESWLHGKFLILAAVGIDREICLAIVSDEYLSTHVDIRMEEHVIRRSIWIDIWTWRKVQLHIFWQSAVRSGMVRCSNDSCAKVVAGRSRPFARFDLIRWCTRTFGCTYVRT